MAFISAAAAVREAVDTVSVAADDVSRNAPKEETDAASGTPANSLQVSTFTDARKASNVLRELVRDKDREIRKEAATFERNGEQINRSTVRNCD